MTERGRTAIARIPVIPATSLESSAQSFARHLRAERNSLLTIRTYLRGIEGFDRYLTEQGRTPTLQSITREDVENYLNYLHDERENPNNGVRGLAPSTVNQRYKSLQQFFRWAVNEGEIDQSPLARINPPRVPDNPPPVLTPDEIRALYATCGSRSLPDRRDLAILHLFNSTGIRRAEMAALRVADLDLDQNAITVTGKGGRRRTVTFGNGTARALDRYLRVRDGHRDHDHPALWLGQRGPISALGIKRIVDRRGARAGVKVYPHLFRHGWAAASLALGRHEQDVSELAGWRSPQMVSRYGRAARAARAQEANRTNNPDDLI